ncbi:MAG: hypothetical protein KA371_08830 [Acidobacteria bacterium]|nr:hypothetical protein [Acidobacteriota bacterium]
MLADRASVRLNAHIRFVAILAVLTTALAATVVAHTHIYQSDGNGGWTKIGRIQGGTSQMTIVCGQVGICDQKVGCDFCHAGGVDPVRFDNAQMSRHLQQHFPRRAVRLTPGQPVSFGDRYVELRDGRLTLLNARRQPEARLPSGAVVLPDRSGAAVSIVYAGERPPEVIR